MAIGLISNASAVALGITVPFRGIGGVAPYTYAVIAGAGSIDSNGLYTASSYGTDTIEVTDAALATATLDISVLSHIELVCDIIQTYLNLSNGRVYLFDQKINMPKDQDLFVVVQSIACKPFSNSYTAVNDASGMLGVQYTNFQATLQIDFQSRGIEALNRKEELLMAFSSQYAQTQQELNSFNIALLSTNFVNLSDVDGSAIPYRYNITINIQYAITNEKSNTYYDEFVEPEILTDPEKDTPTPIEIYWGKFPTFTSPTDADILALDGAGFGSGRLEASDLNKTYSNMNGAGQYLMWAWPTSFGNPNFVVNGFFNNAFTKIRSNSPFINEYSQTINYDVWISNTIQNSPIFSIVIS